MDSKKRNNRKSRGRQQQQKVEQKRVIVVSVDNTCFDRNSSLERNKESLYGPYDDAALLEGCRSPHIPRRFIDPRIRSLERNAGRHRSASPAERCTMPRSRCVSPLERRVSEIAGRCVSPSPIPVRNPMARRASEVSARCTSPLPLRPSYERRPSELAARCASPPPPPRTLERRASELAARCASPPPPPRTLERRASELAARCASPPPPPRTPLSRRSSEFSTRCASPHLLQRHGSDLSSCTSLTQPQPQVERRGSDISRCMSPPPLSLPEKSATPRLSRPNHLCLSPTSTKKMSSSPSFNLLYELPFRKEYEIPSVARKGSLTPSGNSTCDSSQDAMYTTTLNSRAGKDGLYRSRSESPSQFFVKRSESAHALMLQTCDEDESSDKEKDEDIYESIAGDKQDQEVNLNNSQLWCMFH